MRLEGKRALITGASHGIGKAIALAYAREGADLVITYRGREAGAQDTARQIRALGRKAHVIHAEMTALDAGVVDQAIAALGGLDILVNNAGGGRGDALLELTLDDWRYTLDLCVTAPFVLGQRAAQHMSTNGGGAIINISSVHSDHVWANDTAYGVAKAALNRLTKSRRPRKSRAATTPRMAAQHRGSSRSARPSRPRSPMSPFSSPPTMPHTSTDRPSSSMAGSSSQQSPPPTT